jgi:hypothetical protein
MDSSRKAATAWLHRKPADGTETRMAAAGAVALRVGWGEAHLTCEVVDPFSLLVAAEVGLRWVPVSLEGDRARGPLVPTVQSFLSRCRGVAGRAWG